MHSKQNTLDGIHTGVLRWYKRHKRDLPWRKTKNPYHILVSEVMLQQTQVDRIIPKYKQFIRQFPSVKKLAEAKTSEGIKAWAGLGYNKRALFLQRAAKTLQEKYKGEFPQTIEELTELAGIGEYTARAILSFSFEQPVPMMDTNHRRFYQRVFFGLRGKRDTVLLKKAQEVLPKDNAYDWNQALMDFGSLVCTTRNPQCVVCPIQQWCKAYPTVLRKQGNVEIQKYKMQKKNSIPFEKTDRYVRGRIIDRLREKEKINNAIMRKEFPHIEDERWKKIVVRLISDGLIKVVGRSILLP